MKNLVYLLFFIMVISLSAQPSTITYQGLLTDDNNEAITGTDTIRFDIYNVETGGTSLWNETQSNVSISNGLFNIELGSVTPFGSLDFSQELWLEITVSDNTLSPRIAFNSSGYSLAGHATSLQITTDAGEGKVLTSDAEGNAEWEEPPKKYQVGDFAQGGIVFWVDETGQHGLVCAKEDQGTGMRWYAGTFGVTRATGDGPFSGELNTAIIISSQVSIGDDGNDYAAQICNDFQVTEGGKTYGDWYLPSKEELNLMYQNKATIDVTAVANGGSGIANTYYWSSTEFSAASSWLQSFSYGSQSYIVKYSANRVRAVRAF